MYGGPCDEGWGILEETWSLDEGGETLRRTWLSDGVDCDGRMTRTESYVCPVSARMSAAPPNMEWASPAERRAVEGTLWPAWKLVSGRQRDYQAEAAGY